jgi:hypothetical protein
MNDIRLCARIAKELFRRAQANETTDIFDLARACDTSLFAALKAVDRMGREGLMDPRRLRLTLEGLALVTAFSREPAAERKQRETGRPLPRARHAA